MTRLTILFASMFLLMSYSAMACDDAVFESGHGLTITAHGEAKGVPDTMEISLVSQATAGTAENAFQECAEQSESAMQEIRELKIANAQIVAEPYRFGPPTPADPFSFPSAAPAATGAVVSQLITVTIPLAALSEAHALPNAIASIVDAAMKADLTLGAPGDPTERWTGEEPANAIVYTLGDDRELRAEALKNAMDSAEAIRQRMSATGIGIGGLVRMEYRDSVDSNSWGPFGTSASTSANEPLTSDTPDSIFAHATLTCVYELADHKRD